MLKYSKYEINSNFKIKVNGKLNGRCISKLVGVSGLIDLVGVDLANKFVSKAFDKGLDVSVFKLRRGLIIRFYSY